MAQQAERLLSRRPLRSSRPVMGKQAEAEQRHTQQTPSGRTALQGQTQTARRRTHGLFPKEPRRQMPNGYVQDARHRTGPPDRSADHARRQGLKSSRSKSQHHHARRVVPARLPSPPPTQRLSKARARLPKAKTKTKPKRTRRPSKRKPSRCNRSSTTCPTTARCAQTSRSNCKVCRDNSKTKEAKGPG